MDIEVQRIVDEDIPYHGMVAEWVEAKKMNRCFTYVLSEDGTTPVPVPNAQEWAKWMQRADQENLRMIMQNRIGTEEDHVLISTVFLGMSADEEPLLFETAIKKDKEWLIINRYKTRREAENRHSLILVEYMAGTWRL